MKIVQSNAISLNGMIARENGAEDWLPAEGWEEFIEDAKKYDNFIVSRETYELVTKLDPNYSFDAVEAKYKIIVTRQPDYQIPSGYVVVGSPEEAVEFLKTKKVEAGLLAGGGKLNTSFYTKGLVDETCVTISPIILGKGRPFIGNFDFETQLKLVDVIRLNKDRVQLRYSVTKG